VTETRGDALSDYTVTVFGATGKTGREVARLAAARGWRVRSAGRRQPAVGDWVRFEWGERDTWSPAMRGSDAAYLVIPFSDPQAPTLMPDLIENAVKVGVSRVVLLSSLDAEHAEPSDPLVQAEQAISALDIPSATLRPTWFFDNFTTGSFAEMTKAGHLRLPAGEGKIPFIDVRDIAQVAVACLEEGGYCGVLPLTGPEAIDHHKVAAALSSALRRPISYTSIGANEFVHTMTARGFSEEYSRFLAAALLSVADGSLVIPVSDTVPQICRRKAYAALQFAEWFAAHKCVEGAVTLD
jgi:uncharacterized protein YbjT (DUF2867 family)